MSEHIFRDAPGFGGETSEYERENNLDHYGTLHEEIVRCRDCRKSYKADEMFFCKMFSAMVEPWRFCSWGEPEQPFAE